MKSVSSRAECNEVEGPRRFIHVERLIGPPGSFDSVPARLRPPGTPLRMTRFGTAFFHDLRLFAGIP